jgi:hypothetical protein
VQSSARFTGFEYKGSAVFKNGMVTESRRTNWNKRKDENTRIRGKEETDRKRRGRKRM